MLTRKRVGNTTPPWGKPYLNSTCLLVIPSTFTLAILLKRKSLSHLHILPRTLAHRSFSSSPSFQTLSKAFDGSKKTARTFFFSWKGSSISCFKWALWSPVLRSCWFPVFVGIFLFWGWWFLGHGLIFQPVITSLPYTQACTSSDGIIITEQKKSTLQIFHQSLQQQQKSRQYKQT